MKRTIKNIAHRLNAFLASLWYGFPGRKVTVIGITGTSGKTTTAHMVYKILEDAGFKASLISTIEAQISGESIDTGFHVTTPSPWMLQSLLKKAVKSQSKYVVLEITSHALDQSRAYGIPIKIGVVTNITHEHLDYHKTLDKYKKAKSKILNGNEISILNKDDKNFIYLKNHSKGKVISFGISKEADVNSKNINLKPGLPGRFNLENALAAASVCLNLGISKEIIQTSIKYFTDIRGHMEEVKSRRNFRVFIDFAHKPDALKKVLVTARDMTNGKVIVVFGCAGMRDTAKRAMMGEIAGELSNYAVFTAEDPRTEDVKDIIRQIANGAACKGMIEGKKGFTFKTLKRSEKYFWRIPDREEAIDFAINRVARNGDIILLCGKGHEKSMCFGTTEYPWDEKKSAEKALRRK